MVMPQKPSGVDAGTARTEQSPLVQFVAVGGVCGAVGGGLGAMVAGQLWGLVFFAVAMGVAWVGLRKSYPHQKIGLCNAATVARLALVSVLVAAVLAGEASEWAVFAVALVAFSLDGVDGWLARREGLASDFGARFDMEVDATLALVLALLAWQSGAVGGYVILLGVPRYGFWLAQFPYPWLNGPLPERFSRKVVCVLQISALIVALFPPVVPWVASLLTAGAAVALVWSFTVDVRVLWRARA